MGNTSEIERIKAAYDRRKKEVPSERYSFFNQANLYMIQRRDEKVLEALKKHGVTDLKGKRVLDLGCGEGGELRNLIRYGARPENLCGIDLLPDRIAMAKEISPNIDFRCGDSSRLPYEGEMFDIVMQFTVFTSILDISMKQSIAHEMLRVLKPDGTILWYDYYMDNPGNPDVRGVKQGEIFELFRGCQIYLKRITLAPPLARAIAPHSTILCAILEKISPLCTHYLGIFKKGH